jgi:hypothetical protein
MEIFYKRPEVLSSQKIIMFEGKTESNDTFYLTAILDEYDGWRIEQVDWDNPDNYDEEVELKIIEKFLEEIDNYDF